MPLRRGGYCYSHYMKNWRHGTPTPVFGHRKDIGGQRYGSLVALGYNRDSRLWVLLCDCGAVVERKAGQFTRKQTRRGLSMVTCGDWPTHRPDDITYATAHSRVRREKGSATTRSCIDCNEPAAQWSYTHTDPKEQYEDRCGPYSADPQYYVPRCVPCHKRFDLARS
jgi:hypothetical protein